MSATDNYIAKRDILVQATLRVERTFAKIRETGDLSHAGAWKKLQVANSNVGLPAEMTFGVGQPTLDARQWPTGDQIASLIAGWHQARREAQSAFEALNQQERNAVKGLPA